MYDKPKLPYRISCKRQADVNGHAQDMPCQLLMSCHLNTCIFNGFHPFPAFKITFRSASDVQSHSPDAALAPDHRLCQASSRLCSTPF